MEQLSRVATPLTRSPRRRREIRFRTAAGMKAPPIPISEDWYTVVARSSAALCGRHRQSSFHRRLIVNVCAGSRTRRAPCRGQWGCAVAVSLNASAKRERKAVKEGAGKFIAPRHPPHAPALCSGERPLEFHNEVTCERYLTHRSSCYRGNRLTGARASLSFELVAA